MLNHWDIEQALVESEIDWENFLILRDGCDEFSGRVLKLNKSLYGLRQSLGAFNQLLMSKFVVFGLKGCASDPFVVRV